jgi:hypothetical protein
LELFSFSPSLPILSGLGGVAMQRDFLQERDNANIIDVFQLLQSGGVRDPKLVPHPPGHACFSIRQRGSHRPVAAAACPDDAALIEHANERKSLSTVPDLDGSELNGPAAKMRVRCWPGRFGALVHQKVRSQG